MIEFIHNFINYNLYNAALVVIATYALLLGIVTLISLICVATIVRVAFSPHIKVLAWSNHTLRSGIERLVPFKDKHIFIFIGLTAFFILFFVPLVFKVSPEIGMFFLGEEKSLEGLFAPAAAAFSGIAFFLMFCTFRSQEKQLKHVAQESKIGRAHV